jgi:predicted HNH restriction endonuclease
MSVIQPRGWPAYNTTAVRALCAVFDFVDYYGDLGDGFIHVHHRRLIAECGGEYVVDPIADLIPVCPNCHAMLHRGTTPPSVEELSQIYDEHVIENDDEQSASDNGS